jgi:hypothetical protein
MMAKFGRLDMGEYSKEMAFSVGNFKADVYLGTKWTRSFKRDSKCIIGSHSHIVKVRIGRKLVMLPPFNPISSVEFVSNAKMNHLLRHSKDVLSSDEF